MFSHHDTQPNENHVTLNVLILDYVVLYVLRKCQLL